MKVIIIRHGKVDYTWSRWCSSGEFDKECKEYDAAAIKPVAKQSFDEKYHAIFVSELVRSQETAKGMFPGAGLRITPLLNEVPLRASLDTERRLPLWFWNISGRLQWFMGSGRQEESRRQTQERARIFVEQLCKEGTDNVVVTHGFFMHELLSVLKKAGFRTGRAHAYYKNEECIIAER